MDPEMASHHKSHFWDSTVHQCLQKGGEFGTGELLSLIIQYDRIGFLRQFFFDLPGLPDQLRFLLMRITFLQVRNHGFFDWKVLSNPFEIPFLYPRKQGVLGFSNP